MALRAFLFGFDEIKNGRMGLAGPAIDARKVTSGRNSEWKAGRLSFGDDGRIYRYTQHRGVVAAAAGMIACRATTSGHWDVTVDNSANLVNDHPAGIYMAAMTNLQWGWLQISGVAEDVQKTDAAVAKGDFLHPADGAAEDGQAETATAGTDANIFGEALEAALAADDTIDRVGLRGLF